MQETTKLQEYILGFSLKHKGVAYSTLTAFGIGTGFASHPLCEGYRSRDEGYGFLQEAFKRSPEVFPTRVALPEDVDYRFVSSSNIGCPYLPGSTDCSPLAPVTEVAEA